MRKKELLAEISNLKSTIAEQQNAIDEQQKVLDFLCEHDRNEVYVDWNFVGGATANHFARFLYQKKVKEVTILTAIGANCSLEIVNNQKDSFVVCTKGDDNRKTKYFKVKKSTCMGAEVTEFFQKKENGE